MKRQPGDARDRRLRATPVAGSSAQLLLLAWLVVPLRACAQAPYLTAEPVWYSAIHTTLDAALGDVDGDGDLDVVLGNARQPSTLYLNEGRKLGQELDLRLAWSSPPQGTGAVALGDVDGDGDLDLVCGNGDISMRQGVTLFLNEGGTFGDTADWTSPDTLQTIDVDLGDVDGDGDLDLVCGSNRGRATLYLNTGGSFAKGPWTPGGDEVQEVALGDVDGDGDLDLACTTLGEARLYENTDGTFSETPVWRSEPWGTWDIALGDVDGDGDMDLVCANLNTSSTLYLNDNGRFGETPAWTSETHPAISTSLGDVDGDGDLDVLLGGLEGISALYLNEGARFADAPAWQSHQPQTTTVAVLGDIDGDGRLDVLCGARDQRASLYLNRGGAFEATPSWNSQDLSARDVVLGDVDGDGDLDLVRCSISSASLYRNEDGDFVPSWSSPPLAVWSVALGDIDGDGDLDLVGTVGPTRTTECVAALWLNDGSGDFGLDPVWSSTQLGGTILALGDVDGDGDLDLVHADRRDGRCSLYLNESARFADGPVWSLQIPGLTSLALGDVDSDDDLDLVCGSQSSFYGSPLYLNEGGNSIFGSDPAWRSPPQATYAVELADVNGDGRLDLVCGNSRASSSTLFLNNGAGFGSTASWASPNYDYASEIALGDVDGDGWLDLVVGEVVWWQSEFYRNLGGTFSTTAPDWFSQVQSNASLALGDIDRDGDLDLVCGNVASAQDRPEYTTLYRGTSSFVLLGDARSLTRHLPNNDAYLTDIRVTQSGTNRYEARCVAFDVESDPVWVVADYQFRGDPRWAPADIEGVTGRLGPLAASPAGTAHGLIWDTSRVPVDPRPVILRLRAVSNPGRAGVVQRVARYCFDLGRIEVRRPMIVATTPLAFPVVTVGDTSSAVLTLANRGNELLSISRLVLPPRGMRFEGAAALDLAPGERAELRVFLEPRDGFEDVENLWVESNDPAHPSLAVSLVTDVRPLEFTARLLVPPQVPAGQALTAVLTPAPDVRIERAEILYRKLGTSEPFASSILEPVANDFIGTIPNAGVTEAGVEYFFRVENSGVVARQPASGVLTITVQAPTSVRADAVPNDGADFTAGRPVAVTVTLPEGSEFVGGVLHFRRGGETSYEIDEIRPQLPLPIATIGANFVTARGVEYWVEVQTLKGMLTDPPLDPASAPRGLRISVPNLEEANPHPAGRFRLVSVPLDVGSGRTVDALLTDEAEFGSYDPVRWRLFRYVRETHTNAEFSPGSELFHAQPGRAFWLISRAEHRIDTSPADGMSISTHAAYPLVVGPGWNQIGNPFAFPVAWESVGAPEAVSALLGFDPTLGTVGDFIESDPTVLEPFAGYFVHNSAAAPETLWVPPVAVSPSPAPAKAVAEAMSMDSWSARLQAKTREAVDGANSFGVDPGASDGHDRLDGLEPPLVPGPWVQVAFAPRERDSRSGLYRRDLRAAGHEGEVWEIELRSQSAAEPVTLALLAESKLPATLGIRLVDREQQGSVDLVRPGGELGSYSLVSYGPNRPYRLALLAGSAGFLEREEATSAEIPAHVVLEHGPNPFSSAARIRFGLPQAQRATLAIYDVRGQRVALLRQDEQMPAGYHASIWNGTDAAGRPLASGVYFCRLETSSTQLIRRLVLLR